MASEALFSGSFVALITPFDSKGRLDRKALEKLVEWHIEEGTDGIVCSATTGEGTTLSEREKKRVAEICIRTAKGRIPIIVGTGTPDTRQSVHLTEQMQKLGADGCLVVTPYYNKPSQRGCILHFQEVAKVGLPVIVYHNPGRAVVRLEAETIAALHQIPGIAALKESSSDLEFVRKIRKLCSIPILSGDDHLTFETIREGGKGAISVVGNVIPKGWKGMIRLALEGKWEKAAELSDKYLPLCKALFLETNPQGVKFAMAWMGKAQGVLRLPLVPVSEGVGKEIERALLSLSLPPFQMVKTLQAKEGL